MLNLYLSLTHTAQYTEILNLYLFLNFLCQLSIFKLFISHLYQSLTTYWTFAFHKYSQYFTVTHSFPLLYLPNSTSATLFPAHLDILNISLQNLPCLLFRPHIHNHLISHIQFTTSILCHRTLFLEYLAAIKNISSLFECTFISVLGEQL